MSPRFSGYLVASAAPMIQTGVFLAFAGGIAGGDDDGAAAVGDHAAFEEVEGVGDDAGVPDILGGDLTRAAEAEVGHGLDGLRVADGVGAGGDGDGGELVLGGAVLVHVALLDHGIVGDEGDAPGVLHVADGCGVADAGGAAGADGAGDGVGDGAVGEEGDVGLAGGDVAGGVGGVELEGGPADVGGVENPGLEAKVLGDLQADGAGLVGVVDGVDVAPGQAGVLEGPGGGGGLDVEGGDAGGRRRAGGIRGHRRWRLLGAGLPHSLLGQKYRGNLYQNRWEASTGWSGGDDGLGAGRMVR